MEDLGPKAMVDLENTIHMYMYLYESASQVCNVSPYVCTCVSWPLVCMLKGESDHNISLY